MRVHIVDIEVNVPDSFGDTPEKVIELIQARYVDIADFVSDSDVTIGYLCVHDDNDQNSKRVRWVKDD